MDEGDGLTQGDVVLSGPRRTYRRRRLGQVNPKLAIVTGLLAFLIAAAALTLPELIFGGAVASHSGTTFFGGGSHSASDKDKGSKDKGSDSGDSNSNSDQGGDSSSQSSGSSQGSDQSQSQSQSKPQTQPKAPSQQPPSVAPSTGSGGGGGAAGGGSGSASP